MNAVLIAARKNLGLNQREAAHGIGVKVDVLSRAEQGLSHPHLKAAKAIADFYHLQVTDIWPVEERDAA